MMTSLPGTRLRPVGADLEALPAGPGVYHLSYVQSPFASLPRTDYYQLGQTAAYDLTTGDVTAATLTMPRLVSLTVTVHDASGAPVAGHSV